VRGIFWLRFQDRNTDRILDITEQNFYKNGVARKIKYIGRKVKVRNKKNKEDCKQIMNIRSKMVKNKLTITKQAKGMSGGTNTRRIL
jgi:hypothetical protein